VSCGESIVRALAARGVDHVFGIPGTHTLALHEALARSSIRHITPRHEQGAGYAADGYARASGRPGVCVVTTGPGLTNVITAAATAHHDSVPLLIITPGMPSFAEGRDIGFLHQVKSQSGAMENIVGRSRRVASAREAVDSIDDAFEHFTNERPRPVHIEIPVDVLEGGATESRSGAGERRSGPPAPDDEQRRLAAEILREAREPWLLLGGGSKDASREARELGELLGAIVVTTVNGKGVVPESHPLSIGASLRLAPARDGLAAADAVVAVGTEISESDLWTSDFSLRGRLVRVDIDAEQLSKNAAPAAALNGDAADVMTGLIGDLKTSSPAPRNGAERASALRSELEEMIARDGSDYLELHRALRAALDEDAIVAGDSSMVTYYGTVHQFPVERPRCFLYPVGYATLGYSLPAAIGAKLAFPERQVVAIDGDGGFLFTATEIASAVELRLPIPIIVFDNRGYGEIRAEMLARRAQPIGVDLAPVDFPALSRALGGRGMTVDDADALSAAVAEALQADRPTLIAINGPLRSASA
jgi:thiamine pyrophosphate-dependent acetolactate synthase large subunit-like protein